MAGKLFGTDGVRGVANQYPMTADFALKLGLACGQKICTQHKKVAIARDTRISGEMLQSSLAAGFLSAGVDVIWLEVLPTPAITSIAEDLSVDMAVMITASHNPYYDNGIKLIDAQGDKFSDEITSALEEMIEKDDFLPLNDKLGRIVKNENALDIYLRKVTAFIDNPHPFKSLKIVLDCANGCFSSIMPQVFKNLGAGVITLGNTPDGYNINLDCGSQHPELLFETVKGSHAHLGIAVDGDGDRILVCDDKGQKIPAEELLAFLACYLKQKGLYRGNALVSTVLANTALEHYMKNKGFEYFSTKVGERAIIRKMKECQCSLGGEESGHIVAGDYCRSGDGMAVALMLCLAIIEEKRPASEIFPLFEFDPFVFVNIKVKDRAMVKAAADDEGVKAAVKEANLMMEDIGRVVLHPSGTESKIRVWVSGSDENKVNKASGIIINEVKKFQEE
ncbi:MAG: phosphoglucosamine mutase [Alphaproteobacteria bacterium]|nr:phosphoglucosamine mutase [Alphaproteobacteria bacterium]